MCQDKFLRLHSYSVAEVKFKLNLLMSTEVKSMMTQPQPTTTPRLEEPKFGFNEYAERLNGRAAMIGFMLMTIIEYVTGQGVLAWLGLK